MACVMFFTPVSLVGFAGGVAEAAFTDSADDITALTTYTFAGQSIGAAAPDRYVVVCIGSNSNARTVSSVTVAGQSCTIIADLRDGSNTRHCAMAITDAPVTSGTTADVVVTFDGSQNGCAVSLYSATGLGSPTAHDSFTSATTDGSGSLDVPANGFGLVMVRDSGTGTTITGLTKDGEQAVDGDVGVLAFGHKEFASTQTGLSVGWNATGGTAAIGASWGP